MKKVFLMALAVAAMTISSCNNGKTNAPKANADSEIGRASCRERVCLYV